MPPLPKPPGHRVRQGTQQANWQTLPAAKPFKRPTLPKRSPPWLDSTKRWWAVLWDSPMASTYLEPDVPALFRLAEMVELRARGELGATETVAMTALEDRFGLNPKARRSLQWEITQAEQATKPKRENVPKLRVVANGS